LFIVGWVAEKIQGIDFIKHTTHQQRWNIILRICFGLKVCFAGTCLSNYFNSTAAYLPNSFFQNMFKYNLFVYILQHTIQLIHVFKLSPRKLLLLPVTFSLFRDNVSKELKTKNNRLPISKTKID